MPPLSRTGMLLGGALIFAAITAIAVGHYLQHRERVLAARLQAQYRGKEVQVVVARSNLPVGALADSQDMATRSVPADLVYPFTVTLAHWPALDGKPLARAVYGGKPLLAEDFTPGRAGDFAAQLPARLRAVTITVSPVNAIAGLLRPGDRVAVLFLAHHREVPLLHHAQVLATGLATVHHGHHPAGGHWRTGFGTITLAVSPRQAGELALAERVGGLRVVLDPTHGKPGPGLPMLTVASLYGEGQGSGGSIQSVQYIIGGSGGNRVHNLPVGETPPAATRAGGPTAALAHVEKRTNKTLATLKTLLQTAPPAAPVTP
ncbi:MAG: Flp pilus assembly protein CpaB [Acidiferrobacter sp.]